MRIALIILIGLHGAIHLFGFVKAFGISECNTISQPISKLLGTIWLVAFFLFAATLLLFLSQQTYWWIIGILAVLVSQFLIVSYWQDAKFGTILNLVILTSTFVAFSTFSFKKEVNEEIAQMSANSPTLEKTIISEQMMVNLPDIVQKWLLNSGIVGKELIQNVYLEQDAQILMKLEQKKWSNAKAIQYFTIEPPAFIWTVNLKMNQTISVVGKDKFENGKGEMIIKLFSLFPIVNIKSNKKVNQATLQRYLAEIVWFPSSSLNPYMSWEKIDSTSAKATMTYNGTTGSGIFHFDENGNFKKFVAMRFKDPEDIEPIEWTVTATKTEEKNGIKIPVECEANWKLENGNWTWLKLKVTDVAYNVQKMPVVNND